MTPPTAPQTVQLDPQIRAKIQIGALQHVVERLTDELTYAHMQGAELEKQLAAALAEIETLKKSTPPKARGR